MVGVWAWPSEPSPARGQPILPIPLAGGPELPEAEISGLAWHEDELVLLPQYPARFGGSVFVAARRDLEAFIAGRSRGPVRVRRVPLDAPGLEDALPGFDGYEAIAFAGEDVYCAVEARPDPEHTVGYLLRGHAAPGRLERITIDVSHRARLAAQTDLTNTGYEAITVQGERVLALYEANGDINPHPRVLAFDRALEPEHELALGELEYRVTDATTVDSDGRFWVANYHWPGSPWQPGVCRLTEQYGRGESHARCTTVERLVELAIVGGRVEPTARPPILLELVDDLHARNWEGVVRMPGGGFLMMTDEHPASILAFVAAD
jgi:hypothetical protein